MFDTMPDIQLLIAVEKCSVRDQLLKRFKSQLINTEQSGKIDVT